MKTENIKILTDILKDFSSKKELQEDKEKIMFFHQALQKLETRLPNMEELEALKKIEVELEVKYESLFEIGNYFDPIYVEVEKEIHQKEVQKLREENKKRRKKENGKTLKKDSYNKN